MRPAWLTVFIALNGFTVAVVVAAATLAFHFAVISWKAPPQECADVQTGSPPPVAPIPAPCKSEKSISNVVVDPGKNPWVGELVSVLQQIQANSDNSTGDMVINREKNLWVNELIDAIKQAQVHDNNGGSISNVVIDPKKNPWIDKLINALHDAGKRQSCVPDTGANPGGAGNNQPKGQTGNPAGTHKCENVPHAVTVNMEKPSWVDELLKSLNGVALIDPDENEWIKDMVDALQQIQMKLNDDSGIRHVVLDPEKNKALMEALQDRGVAPGIGNGNQLRTTTSTQETAVASNIDHRLRKRIRKKMDCNDGEELFLSKYIHFPTGGDSIESAEKCKINDFMRNDGARATKWGVFGFASESGSNEMNRELSWQRACAVKEFICDNDNPPSCQTDCKPYPKDGGGQAATGLQCLPAEGDEKTDPLICFLGEQHFINGVADSRSAAIAACRTKEPSG